MKPYRARRIDNEKEIFGSHCIADGRHFIVPVGAKYDYEDDDDGNRRIILYDGIHEVHPDSVSQSTGREDKHGVEIYGGMKVKCDRNDSFPSYNEAIVVYIDDMAAFMLQYTKPINPKGVLANCHCPVSEDKTVLFGKLTDWPLEIIPEGE